MKLKAKANYHVKKDFLQQEIIDADGIKGRILFPELLEKEIEIHDIDTLNNTLNYEDHSLEFFRKATSVKNFHSKDSLTEYNQELIEHIKNEINAKEVIVFDHTIRDEIINERPPAKHVHNDYSEESGHKILERFVPKANLNLWKNGHFEIINSWRPIERVVKSSPLAFIDPRTFNEEDLIKIELVYPDRKGEILGALFNHKHKWVFKNEMSPDDLVIFKVFDSRKKLPVFHSALELADSKHHGRKSIESRMLVRF